MQFLRSRLAWILIGLVVLLVLVAAVSAGAYLILRGRDTVDATWQDPVAAILPDQIAPDLALYPLAGALELDTIDAAIEGGALETAYATLVLGTDLTDAQRVGRLILLGRQFEAVEAWERAALAYQQVYDLAILSPRLNDPTRADALLASGRGWAALEEVDRALNAYDQVYLIAIGSPNLQLANRRELLMALETAYQDLDEEARADTVRGKIIELDQDMGPMSPAGSGPQPELLLGEAVPSSPEIGALEEARRQVALALLEAYADPEQGEPTEALVSAVADALRAEDEAKLAFYNQALEETVQPGRRVGLHQWAIEWLMIKYRVATRGFGVSLVPEWENDLAGIQSALSRAYQELFFEYEDLVTALPDATLMAPGRYQVRRDALLDGRLGRYVNYPAQQLAEKLQSAAQELIAAGAVDRLYIDVRAGEEGTWYFFLSPAADYGAPTPVP
jgi:hypothetical protein